MDLHISYVCGDFPYLVKVVKSDGGQFHINSKTALGALQEALAKAIEFHREKINPMQKELKSLTNSLKEINGLISQGDK